MINQQDKDTSNYFNYLWIEWNLCFWLVDLAFARLELKIRIVSFAVNFTCLNKEQRHQIPNRKIKYVKLKL